MREVLSAGTPFTFDMDAPNDFSGNAATLYSVDPTPTLWKLLWDNGDISTQIGPGTSNDPHVEAQTDGRIRGYVDTMGLAAGSYSLRITGTVENGGTFVRTREFTIGTVPADVLAIKSIDADTAIQADVTAATAAVPTLTELNAAVATIEAYILAHQGGGGGGGNSSTI